MVPCESLTSPMNPSTPMYPLQGSGVSDRCRCGAVRILELADEPSTGIGRVGALSLWSRANPLARWRTLCGDRACRIARRRTRCGDRCGAVRILAVADEPSTGIGRVGSLAGEPSAGIGVVPCASLPWPMNPLQGSGVSDRSSANPLWGSVWCRAHPCRGR